MIRQNQDRKLEQLQICLQEEVGGHAIDPGFSRVRFMHKALPDVSFEEVDTSINLFGKPLRVPIVVSAMTGGTPWAAHINQSLAAGAQEVGAAMSVGSQRTAIDDPSLVFSYVVRDVAPDVLLFANLGAVQLNYGYGVDQCRQALEMIGADALVLHLNSLQEVLQHAGNTDFKGLLGKIERVCDSLEVPVIVKEVGYGIPADTARQLISVGVAGIDVAGAGGTSWSEVERHRLDKEFEREIAGAFASWGIATADCILSVRQALPDAVIIGSGGIRNGVEIAKALALGADAAGMAGALLRPATISAEAVSTHLKLFAEQLKVAMFCVGARTVPELRQPGILAGTGL